MTSGGKILEARWQKFVYAGEIIWIAQLLFALFCGYVTEIHPLRNDYMQSLVDVPASVAPYLVASGVDLQRNIPPAMDRTFMPWVGYTAFIGIIGITGVIAALRGRYYLLLACIAGLAIPGAPFGYDGATLDTVILIAFLAVCRCLVKSQPKEIGKVAIPAVVAWGLIVMMTPEASRDSLIVHRDSDVVEARKVQAVEAALARMNDTDGAAKYVRAQIAYIHHDWEKLKAIGPVDGRGFHASPYKASRLRVLKASLIALAPSPRPESFLAQGTQVLFLMMQLFFLCAFAFSIFTGLLHRRIKRIGKIESQLEALRPVRTVG
ncbi:hypothetical protein [Asticcacaulis sp. 201]|uniref:hypothetical protein n=1 Tax=Asticcacaulis sp. 201 TaxID=3028787 RepID=UPI002916D1B3|nr:hypothetical protein [Asticcacaulis sp. 201]MDV6330138.1 hypothetical protein [Asticcacaulis sp. 201]